MTSFPIAALRAQFPSLALEDGGSPRIYFDNPAGTQVPQAVIDRTLEAMKAVTEFREASRQMGRQTLRVGAALTEEARLVAYAGDVERALAPGHHAVAYGLVAAALAWTPEATATAFLYSSTALLVGAALRLLPMGQLEGQRVLWALHPVIERVARDAVARDVSDVWSFAPGIELAGIRHASLEMRLFRS